MKPERGFISPLFADLCMRKATALPLPTSPARGGGVGTLPAGGEGWGGERNANKIVHGMTFEKISKRGESLAEGARP